MYNNTLSKTLKPVASVVSFFKIMKPNENIRLLYIDLFCGAGGTSTGVENAAINGKKIAK